MAVMSAVIVVTTATATVAVAVVTVPEETGATRASLHLRLFLL